MKSYLLCSICRAKSPAVESTSGQDIKKLRAYVQDQATSAGWVLKSPTDSRCPEHVVLQTPAEVGPESQKDLVH